MVLYILVSVTYCEDIVLNHGQINQSRPISVGQSVHVTCNHGYQLLEGDVVVLKCEEPGNYNHNIPTCTGKKFSCIGMKIVKLFVNRYY